MDSTRTLGTFIGVATLLAISPGADTLLVLRSVMRFGRRAGFCAVAGIAAGCIVHATVSAFGVSAVVLHSPRAFDALTVAGAAYLWFLGIRSVHAAVSPLTPLVASDREEGSRATALRDGLVTNLLNPKVAVFYLAFVPQFIQPGSTALPRYVTLVGIHVGLGVVWLCMVAVGAEYARRWLLTEGVRRVIDASIGLALLTIGTSVLLG